jgi:hypothetical protein
MRERVEQVLQQLSDFVWLQFEKDLAMSEKIVAFFDHALESITRYFQPRN